MSKAYNEDLVLNNMSVFVGVESLGSITKQTFIVKYYKYKYN